jgi:hypothetical protein
MKRVWPILALLMILAACHADPGQKSPAEVQHVSFLTREGCVKSPAMYANLQAAMAEEGWVGKPVIVDIGKLPRDDPRTGYGTPTVLVDGSDLFGLPLPEPAAPM